MSKLPDRFTRITVMLGLVLGVLGFILSIYNYKWQKKTYLESLEERVLVRPIHWTIHPGVVPTIYDDLLVEVVNIGMRPVFIKKVAGKVYGTEIVLFNTEPIAGAPVGFHPMDTLKKLEPGESSNFDVRLDSYQGDRSNGTFKVTVTTTTKEFKQETEVQEVKR